MVKITNFGHVEGKAAVFRANDQPFALIQSDNAKTWRIAYYAKHDETLQTQELPTRHECFRFIRNLLS